MNERAWDVDLLGEPYAQTTLTLRNGEVATLVRRPRANGAPNRGVMFYLHGFVDYFFQRHVADHFAVQGWAWYALELRRYGRSIRPGQTPWSTRDLREYDEELDAALAVIRAEAGGGRVVMMAHSTGGLIAPLWLARRAGGTVDGLILNSPWLDLQKGWFNRTVVTWVIRQIARVRPMMALPERLGSLYAQSIHRSGHGEWTFETAWKPLTPQLVSAGFIATVRDSHRTLHRGLGLTLPTLLLHSDRSILTADRWSDALLTADCVLDVQQMDRWAACLSRDVTTRVIWHGLHDLFLSREDARREVFAAVDGWLTERFDS